MPRGGKRPGAGRKPAIAKQIAANAGARKPALQRPRKSKKRPQQTSAKSKLTPRQGKLLEGISQLKSQEQAALDAGYSPSAARSACRILDGPSVLAELGKILRRWIDPEKLGLRIAEGLDAMETRFFQSEGVVTDSRDVIAWGERRAYIEMAAKYAGYHIDKQEIAVAHVPSREDDDKRIEELFALATAREKEPVDPGRTN